MNRIKYIIEKLIGIALLIFRLFPLKDRVIFSSFSGRQYSDSPRRISEYLYKNHPEIEQIWAFCEPETFPLLKKKGIKRVKYKSLKYLYYALTSRVYVDNVEIWSILRFRRGQTAIQTWHGGGAYKRVGTDRLDVNDAHKKHSVDKMNRMDIFLSSSKAFTEMTVRGSFGYKGEVLEIGLPRNDELLCPDEKRQQSIKAALGIPDDNKVVIYAPTFRNSLSLKLYDVDLARVSAALKEKFGSEFTVLLRLHYYIEDKQLNLGESDNIIDVTDYPDMQELLSISDVLITDYSSTMWDFSLMYKPCFLYATDIGEYKGERDFYTSPDSWPFALSENNEELCENIKAFDIKQYVEKVAQHHKALGSCESGSATKLVANRILEILKK